MFLIYLGNSPSKSVSKSNFEHCTAAGEGDNILQISKRLKNALEDSSRNNNYINNNISNNNFNNNKPINYTSSKQPIMMENNHSNSANNTFINTKNENELNSNSVNNSRIIPNTKVSSENYGKNFNLTNDYMNNSNAIKEEIQDKNYICTDIHLSSSPINSANIDDLSKFWRLDNHSIMNNPINLNNNLNNNFNNNNGENNIMYFIGNSQTQFDYLGTVNNNILNPNTGASLIRSNEPMQPGNSLTSNYFNYDKAKTSDPNTNHTNYMVPQFIKLTNTKSNYNNSNTNASSEANNLQNNNSINCRKPSESMENSTNTSSSYKQNISKQSENNMSDLNYFISGNEENYLYKNISQTPSLERYRDIDQDKGGSNKNINNSIAIANRGLNINNEKSPLNSCNTSFANISNASLISSATAVNNSLAPNTKLLGYTNLNAHNSVNNFANNNSNKNSQNNENRNISSAKEKSSEKNLVIPVKLNSSSASVSNINVGGAANMHKKSLNNSFSTIETENSINNNITNKRDISANAKNAPKNFNTISTGENPTSKKLSKNPSSKKYFNVPTPGKTGFNSLNKKELNNETGNTNHNQTLSSSRSTSNIYLKLNLENNSNPSLTNSNNSMCKNPSNENSFLESLNSSAEKKKKSRIFSAAANKSFDCSQSQGFCNTDRNGSNKQKNIYNNNNISLNANNVLQNKKTNLNVSSYKDKNPSSLITSNNSKTSKSKVIDSNSTAAPNTGGNSMKISSSKSANNLLSENSEKSQIPPDISSILDKYSNSNNINNNSIDKNSENETNKELKTSNDNVISIKDEEKENAETLNFTNNSFRNGAAPSNSGNSMTLSNSAFVKNPKSFLKMELNKIKEESDEESRVLSES